MKFQPAVPILRIFDERKAGDFYIDFLGFKVDWEHRFEPETPIYVQISLGGALLHLSEHHGDASPGGSVRIGVDEIDAYHARISSLGYRYHRPSVEPMPWGTREMKITDPFFNRVTFVGMDKKD